MSSVNVTPQQHRPDTYIRRVVITVVVVGLAYITWQVRDVSMIVFGGILVATLLTTLAHLLRVGRHSGKIRQNDVNSLI